LDRQTKKLSTAPFAIKVEGLLEHMNLKNRLLDWIRGWLPEEPDSGIKRILGRAGLNRKLGFIIILGILVVLVIGTIFVLSVMLWMLNPIVPADVKMYHTLEKNQDVLFSIDGVIGAGIARNSSSNHIIGIAVYVEDNFTDVQEIPDKLGEFTVFIKRISEISEFEKERMLIRRDDLQ
jgi:hypothetical protein